MTTPVGGAPEGGLTQGGTFNKDVTEETAKAAIGNPVRGSFQTAQDNFKQMINVPASVFDNVAFVTETMDTRLALLEGVSGYVSSYMGNNWNIPNEAQWYVLPFNKRVGPAKKASVFANGTGTGWLKLDAGGLWRVDLLLQTSGYTMSQTITPLPFPPYFTVVTTYESIVPRFLIEVIDDQGNLITARRQETRSNLYGGGFGSDGAPTSTHFSHTFVLDRIENEGRSVYVRASMSWTKIQTGTFAGAECKVKGGSMYSALTATRWSQDVNHLNYAPTVPDGGNLG